MIFIGFLILCWAETGECREFPSIARFPSRVVCEAHVLTDADRLRPRLIPGFTLTTACRAEVPI